LELLLVAVKVRQSAQSSAPEAVLDLFTSKAAMIWI
jgi:hypothetical protein